MEKEDYDVHIDCMVENLIRDFASYNINYREKFHNIRDTHDYLEEEIEEAEEALKLLKEDERKLWKEIREDSPLEDHLFGLECVEKSAKHLVVEALHIAAVARKAIVQLDIVNKEKAPAGGNQADAHKK